MTSAQRETIIEALGAMEAVEAMLADKGKHECLTDRCDDQIRALWKMLNIDADELETESLSKIDQRTAEKALKTVELYANENKLIVEGKFNPDGLCSYAYKKPRWVENETT